MLISSPFLLYSLRRHQLAHARLLVGWASVNLIAGGTAMFFTDGQWHHFYHMNAAWGSINLIVGGAFWYTSTRLKSPLSRLGKKRQERRFGQFLTLNLGLDWLYLLAGFWLYGQGNGADVNSPLLRGFGQAVMLQGTALLTLDTASLTSSLQRCRQL